MSQQPMILDLDKILQDKLPNVYNKIPRFFINWLKRKVHLAELNEILTVYANDQGVDFACSCVEYFNLKLNVSGLDNIDKNRHYVFVSNHPLGGLDGICLSAVIGDYFDKKIKYIVNDVLYFIQNLQTIFVPVNKYGAQSRKSAALIDEAYTSDNQVVTFPAGLCSRKSNGQVYDLEWKKSFIQKAIETERDVIPIYFDGHNSNFFYRFANIRKRLGIKFNIELLFLPDEMFKNKNQTFSIVFGQPIPYSTFDNTKSAGQWAEYVKEKAYKLAESI